MARHTVAEAQARLPELLARARAGEEVVIALEDGEAVELLPVANTDPLIVSNLTEAEFAAAVGAKRRRGEITRQDTLDAFRSLDAWLSGGGGRAALTAADIALATSWLRRLDLNLRAPHAFHLALASRLGAPVATFDLGMEAVARQLRVPIATA